jgi:hypothetical protein
MLFLDIVNYFILSCNYYKLLLVITNYFILCYFQLCEVIVGYFLLLKTISSYTIIGTSKLL